MTAAVLDGCSNVGEGYVTHREVAHIAVVVRCCAVAAARTDGRCHVDEVHVVKHVAIICASVATTVGECKTLSIVGAHVGNCDWAIGFGSVVTLHGQLVTGTREGDTLALSDLNFNARHNREICTDR